MKILYISDSSFPLATLAGAIHTGRLTVGEQPVREGLWELLSLSIRGGPGKIVSLGEDQAKNMVYALSIKGERDMVYRLVQSFLRIYNIQKAEIWVVDNKFKDNIFLLSGKLLLRYFAPLAPLGCLLSAIGIKKIYGELAGWVLSVKAGGTNPP